MRFKKVASLLAAAAVVTSAFSFSASALNYTYTMEDLSAAPTIFKGTPAAMGADGKLDALWDKADAIELKAMGKAVRVGLKGDVKMMWDADSLHVLLTVSGDSIAKAEGKEDFNTASWEDYVAVMVSQTWATTDEEAPELYQRDTFGDTDIAFEVRRMAEEGKERIVKAVSWGGSNGEIVEGVTNSVLDSLKAGVQSHEINDDTASFQMQMTIPWVDKTLAADGRIIGFDVDYGDWLGMAETYPGIFTEGSEVAKPHLYFGENYAEGLDNPASNAPVILSAIPVEADETTGMLYLAMSLIPDKADITLEDEEDVAALREAYDQLNDTQKALLADVYPRLTAAEAKIAELKASSSSSESSEPDSSSSVPDSSSSSNENATSSNASNPETGVPAAALPLILLAGAAAAVAVCRKKSNG